MEKGRWEVNLELKWEVGIKNGWRRRKRRRRRRRRRMREVGRGIMTLMLAASLPSSCQPADRKRRIFSV